MSADGIFLKAGSELVLLRPTPYDSEAILQTALAEHPEVIAGPTTEEDTDARLLLITREMGVPSAEGGTGTFSLDHLFIDHEGVPVLVEVKRSSDTRIRREVIGQMLDYAANAVKYWPLPLLQQALEKRAENLGRLRSASTHGGPALRTPRFLELRLWPCTRRGTESGSPVAASRFR